MLMSRFFVFFSKMLNLKVGVQKVHSRALIDEICAMFCGPRMFLWCHCCPGTPQSLMTRMIGCKGESPGNLGSVGFAERLRSFPRWKTQTYFLGVFHWPNGWEFKDPNSTCFHIFFNQRVGFQVSKPTSLDHESCWRVQKIAVFQVVEPPWRYDKKGFDLVIFWAKDEWYCWWQPEIRRGFTSWCLGLLKSHGNLPQVFFLAPSKRWVGR